MMTDNYDDARVQRVGRVLIVPVVLLIAGVLALVVMAGQYTSVRLAGDDDGTVTSSWQCLLDDGYRGSPGDGKAELYPSRLDALLCGASDPEGI